MNGFKYWTWTAVCMVAVLLGFIIVLGQFTPMVYPDRITAFSFNTGEKGFCQVDLLGEKLQLPVPDLALWSGCVAQNRQTLTQNVYQALARVNRAARQAWDTRMENWPLEEKFKQLLNTFETYVHLPLQELWQRGWSHGGRN